MSSNLKDARWQVATDLAKQRHEVFLDLDYDAKNVYLEEARAFLELSPELVDHMAERWRAEENPSSEEEK